MKVTNGGIILAGMWAGAGAGLASNEPSSASVLFIAIIATAVWLLMGFFKK